MALLCAVGCRTYPRWNKPLDSFVPGNGYRFENLQPNGNSDSLLLILTFSGGGTRAASLAYGTLEKLADTEIVWEGKRKRLIDEVDVISSVSGGSLAAMYYGLFGDRIFSDFRERVLYRDVQGEFIDDLRRLRNYAKLASPFYGRTDLLAEWFHEGVFERQTYGDLLARGRRPFIIVNATDLEVGLPFEFTQAQFDLIYSDLLSYPVGNAVAASASFPGLLTPMTVRNFVAPVDVPLPAWAQEALESGDYGGPAYQMAEALDSYRREYRRYIHLVDGGVADNLGLLPVTRSIRGAGLGMGMGELIESGRARKVVIVVVNAMAATTTGWAQTPEIIDVFSVLGAVSNIPLGNFAQMQLEYLRLLIEKYQEDLELRQQLEDFLGEWTDALPALDEPLPPVEFKLIEVSFQRVADPGARQFFEHIPTTFSLPAETVDRLRHVAGEILDAHPDFQRLRAELSSP